MDNFFRVFDRLGENMKRNCLHGWQKKRDWKHFVVNPTKKFMGIVEKPPLRRLGAHDY